MTEKTLCFSGHRPEKLPFNGDEGHPATRRLKSLLAKEIRDSIEEGYTCFIAGLARGVDNWAARIVLDEKLRNPEIKLICVKPYEGHGDSWKGVDRWELSHILESADEVVTLCPSYQKGCMKKRNEYMVNHSSKLIAVVSDYKSGTGQTIRYAQKQGLALRIIDLNANKELF